MNVAGLQIARGRAAYAAVVAGAKTSGEAKAGVCKGAEPSHIARMTLRRLASKGRIIREDGRWVVAGKEAK